MATSRAVAAALALAAVALTASLAAQALPIAMVPSLVPVAADPALRPAPTSEPAGSPAVAAADPSIHVEAAPVPQLVPIPDGQGGYTAASPLTFKCPNAYDIASQPPQRDPTDRTDITGCPFRVYDSTYSFGNTALAVNPNDERQAIFTSLHSGPDDGGATPRSRSPEGAGDTHTAFTTQYQGVAWDDQPISGGSPGRGVDGESSAVAMDPKGNLYIAYLWSTPPAGNVTLGGENVTVYGSTIGLYKGAATTVSDSVDRAYGSPVGIDSRSPTDPIARVGLVYVPPLTPPAPEANATGNLTGGPANATEVGDQAVGEHQVNQTQERVAAVWFERATAAPWGPHGYPGWIDAAFTGTSPKNGWSRLPDNSLIGPCLDGSNPVAWQGQVYVACVVDKGYNARGHARIGDVDVWAIDPITGKSVVVGTTDLVGGHPMLAVTQDGYFVAATTRFQGAGVGSSIVVATGWYGRQFGGAKDIGPLLHQMAGSQQVYDATLTGLAVSERTKMYAVSYMEWQKPGDATHPQPPPLPDPSNPVPQAPRLMDYKKIIAVGKECDQFPLAAAAMQLGTGIDATNMQAYTERPSVYDDFQDGLVTYREPTGEDLWYFAVNDYGAVQFGAVVTNVIGSTCPLAPPPPLPPPVPVPQALTVASAANIVVGSTVGVAASAMVLYLLTVKRRVATTAAAEDK